MNNNWIETFLNRYEHRSFRFKVVGLFLACILTLQVLSPIILNLVIYSVVEDSEQQLTIEQNKLSRSAFENYIGQLVLMVRGFVANDLAETLTSEDFSPKHLDNDLIGFDNMVNSSHQVTKIELWNDQDQKLLEHKIEKQTPSFIKNKLQIKAFVKDVLSEEHSGNLVLRSDDGAPWILVAYPSVDADDDYTFVHLYYLNFAGYLKRTSEILETPVAVKFGDKHYSYADLSDGLYGFLADTGDSQSSIEGTIWKKRTLETPQNWMHGNAHLVAMVDVTSYVYKMRIINTLLILVLGLLTAVFCRVAWVLTNRMIDPLKGSMSGIDTVADESEQFAEEINKTSESFRANIEETYSLVMSTSTSATQISSMLNRTNEVVANTTELSNQSLDNVKQGLDLSQEMSQGIEQINESLESTFGAITKGNEKFAKLTGRIEDIQDKTKVINDIVLKSRLLSFNAAIEAARAGEAGRGFGIVAEEVGNLAEMSGKASAEIFAIISLALNDVQRTIDGIEKTTKYNTQVSMTVVENAFKIGESFEEQFNKISENFTTLGKQIDQLKVSSSEQSTAVKSITESMHQIESLSLVGRQNAALNKELAAEIEKNSCKLGKATDTLRGVFYGEDESHSATDCEAPAAFNNSLTGNSKKAS